MNSGKDKTPNSLINESSPYLLQHAYNPVNWLPFSDAAFEKAKKENKPVLISIGYSACHWCHVMEHESFEDADVAKLMNTHFINIKVVGILYYYFLNKLRSSFLSSSVIGLLLLKLTISTICSEV